MSLEEKIILLATLDVNGSICKNIEITNKSEILSIRISLQNDSLLLKIGTYQSCCERIGYLSFITDDHCDDNLRRIARAPSDDLKYIENAKISCLDVYNIENPGDLYKLTMHLKLELEDNTTKHLYLGVYNVHNGFYSHRVILSNNESNIITTCL